MRRYFFHILAFCTGETIGVVASFIVLLIAIYGLHRLPRALWVYSHALNEEVIKGPACYLILAVIIFTACALVQKVNGKFRLNSRYVISVLAGGLHPLIVTSILLTITHVGLWSRMSSDNQGGTLMGAVLGVLFIVGFVARQFSSEIEPGLGFCHSCGYDLRMLDATRCPECGEQIINSVSVKPIRSCHDLDGMQKSRFAIIYLRHPQDRLEEESWVSFIQRVRANIDKFPDADVYEVDVTQPLIKQWIENASPGYKIGPTDHIAFVIGGEILALDSTIMSSYYLRHGPHSLPGFKDTQVKPSSSPPAHFPNSFKKSTCIGRPSSLSFPYKH